MCHLPPFASCPLQGRLQRFCGCLRLCHSATNILDFLLLHTHLANARPPLRYALERHRRISARAHPDRGPDRVRPTKEESGATGLHRLASPYGALSNNRDTRTDTHDYRITWQHGAYPDANIPVRKSHDSTNRSHHTIPADQGQNR
jgi:hypothetical protein